MVEMDIEAARLANTPREEAVAGLQEIRLRLLDLQEERAALSARITLATVRAPVAGIVNGLEIPGREAVVAPAQPILYIVPQDRPLLVAARLPPRHVGQVFTGQDVRVRLTSLAHADAPDLRGRVTRISAAAFEDSGQGASYYRVDITLDPAARQMLDRRGALRPGMAVEAFMKTGRRSPIDYFTAPIASYFAHAFRES
jgi:HlyD family secretion protein